MVGGLAGRSVSARVVIWPCWNLLSPSHAHDNVGLITCRSCHIIICSLLKVPFRSSSLSGTYSAHSSNCCPVANMGLTESGVGFHGISIYLDTRGSYSYSIDIHCIQERAHSSPLPIPLPSSWWGMKSGSRHHLWGSPQHQNTSPNSHPILLLQPELLS